ncbi:MAG: cyclic nucleotide-binding domain-containing protein [Pseudomonadota bacterium]
MDEQEKFDILRSSPFAVELTDGQCRELARVIKVRKLKDGEVLIQDGRSDNSLHVVINGMLAVIKESGAGETTTLHIIKIGDLAGAMGFIDGLEHSATLSSIGDSEVFTLQRDAFESLLHKDPALVYRVMRSIVRSVHAIIRRMNNQYVELTNYISKQHGRY